MHNIWVRLGDTVRWHLLPSRGVIGEPCGGQPVGRGRGYFQEDSEMVLWEETGEQMVKFTHQSNRQSSFRCFLTTLFNCWWKCKNEKPLECACVLILVKRLLSLVFRMEVSSSDRRTKSFDLVTSSTVKQRMTSTCGVHGSCDQLISAQNWPQVCCCLSWPGHPRERGPMGPFIWLNKVYIWK